MLFSLAYCSDFLQHSARHGHLVLQLEQFQHALGVDRIGLGRCRKYLFEAGQLEVVDAVQPPAAHQNTCVQRTGVAAVALHRHRDVASRVPLLVMCNAREEVRQSRPVMGNVKLFQQFPIVQSNCHAMPRTAYIHGNTQFICTLHGLLL